MPPMSDPREPRSPRHGELIAAAAAEQLSAEEAQEYAALVAADSTVATETAELRAALDRVGGLGGWHEPRVSPDLTERILAIPGLEGHDDVTAADDLTSRRRGARRFLPGLAAAAALVVLGGVGGAVVDDWRERAPQGPPGTLGAVEPIDFEVEAEGVDIEASLVAHTWGTETVLDMGGWTPGDRFQVVLVGTDGETEDSGTFLGSQVEIDCRMNGSLLREEVDVIEIRDDRGRVVASSDVPAVEA